jgi:hypothetical protein
VLKKGVNVNAKADDGTTALGWPEANFAVLLTLSKVASRLRSRRR